MKIDLYPYQEEAVEKMHNGCILVGGVGTGKSITSLTYYYNKVCKGHVRLSTHDRYSRMREPRDLYIITTARKRDSLEWDSELSRFCLLTGTKTKNESNVKIFVDSWNNIKKYQKVFGAMFIFDEQRVVGYGAWTKAFLDICRKNRWILLSATPADTWSDLMPAFIANGFYSNKTEFTRNHIVYKRFAKYPQIDRYVGLRELERHRNDIYVVMKSPIEKHKEHYFVRCEFDRDLYDTVWKKRWDPYDNCPIKETGKLCYLLQRVTNSDATRIALCTELIAEKRKSIIFYNYEFELNILRQICESINMPYAEWNGQKHEMVPEGDDWVYIVQYAAGSEAWNCITTDTIIFYSQNYSYKKMIQAAGRIDRANSPYEELYYYHFVSQSSIDKAIDAALEEKEKFNEKKFIENGGRRADPSQKFVDAASYKEYLTDER